MHGIPASLQHSSSGSLHVSINFVLENSQSPSAPRFLGMQTKCSETPKLITLIDLIIFSTRLSTALSTSIHVDQ